MLSLRPFILVALLAPLACASRSSTVKQPPAPSRNGAVSLDDLRENQVVDGWRTTALYTDATDAPIGAHFVHEATGLAFDYLRIESAPQGYVWVNSFPTSDKGEPHTQEHLLLGKGNRGRHMGSVEAMSLATSSAFTEQWRTSYTFNTVAGHDVFWTILNNTLEALLNPDYSDEEIRREVRNFGVGPAPDGGLRLEEKGTVYNEMVSTYDQPDVLVWDAASRLIYGPTHPLALSSGGTPDAIREMTPEDIRGFHREHYYLGNMGFIGAFPSSMALGDVLAETKSIVDRLSGRTGQAMTAASVPAAKGAAAGTTQIVDYPLADASSPSAMMLAWPATRALPVADRLLLTFFLDAVAGDESTNLYRRLVNSKTRTLDVGITSISSGISADEGQPIYLTFEGVKATAQNDKGIADVRATVADELARIAALPAGDPALIALNQRVASRITDRRRQYAKFLNSPPGFGQRGVYSAWMQHLLDLERIAGFKKSLTMKPALAQLDAIVAAPGNPWTRRIKAWGLLDAPYGVAARPSPALRKRLDDDRQARLDAERQRLASAYGLTAPADVLARFKTEYDAASATLDASAKGQVMPPFIDTPPLTLDDELRYEAGKIAGVPLVASHIDSMTSGTVALAFRLDAVPADQLVYLALLPTLLTDAGIVVDGKATPSDEVKEAMRREILSLDIYYQTSPRTGRAELAVQGAGNDVAEAQRALYWMSTLTQHPDWRIGNLVRLRDIIDQRITVLRNTMRGSEEDWVEGPAMIYWRQRWPLFAHTTSFLTQLHDIYRLRWMLSDPGDAKAAAAVAGFLRALAPAGKLDRAHLTTLTDALEQPPMKDRTLTPYLEGIAKLPPVARTLLAQAGKDLRAQLADIPDDSLAADWAYLCKQMATDLEVGAPTALAQLDAVRRAIIHPDNARAWMVGSTATGTAMRGDLERMLTATPRAQLTRQQYSDAPFIQDRLRARKPDAKPLFVGLVNPNSSSGVFESSAPGASFGDTQDDPILDYLAGNLYTGHGGHGLFMKTWGAGLAYSNGPRTSLLLGRNRYYAERCPELPQTVRFVIDVLRQAKPDPDLVDYAIAQSFTSRVAGGYEARARGVADDVTDGVGPSVVRRFRQHILALRDRKDLGAELFRRLEKVYGRVLPGLGLRSADVDDGVYFVIGPDAQMDAWQRYLQTVEGKDTVLYRLYPRDYWVPATVR